jgi:putative toxin-antitoxin system antitoxin component (TIGR02293 family)
MPRETASRAWKLAKMLAQASDVFGSREAAERWMSARAIGLNGDRPIDLLQTGPGADVVSEYLERLELGVYS